jgi:hypothetical protein
MTPVCPACRGQLSLDAYRCPRCGLAVRPTCSSCGEPLSRDTDACWRCASRLDEAPTIGTNAVAVLEAPPVVAVAPPHIVKRKRHRVRRFVLWPIVVAVVLVAAMLAFEMTRPRPAVVDASTTLLHEQVLPRAFSVEVPLRWEFITDPSGATFTDPDEPNASVGVRVVAMKESLAQARRSLAKIDRDLVAGYRPMRTRTTMVDGRPAFRHDFVGEDSVVDQFFVQRGQQTFRIDFYMPADLADAYRPVDDRIITTFREL